MESTSTQGEDDSVPDLEDAPISVGEVTPVMVSTLLPICFVYVTREENGKLKLTIHVSLSYAAKEFVGNMSAAELMEHPICLTAPYIPTDAALNHLRLKIWRLLNRIAHDIPTDNEQTGYIAVQSMTLLDAELENLLWPNWEIISAGVGPVSIITSLPIRVQQP